MSRQWRIQDFPEEGAPTAKVGVPAIILANFSKNCMKMKETGPTGACPWCLPGSANARDITTLMKTFTSEFY